MANQKPTPRSNEMIHCDVCNEDYAATYKRCPFCNEPPRARSRKSAPSGAGQATGSGRRVAGSSRRQSAAVNPIKLIGLVASLIFIIAAFTIVFQWLSPFFGREKPAGNTSNPESSQSPDTSSPTAGGPNGPGASDPTGSLAPVTSVTLDKSDVTLEPGGSVKLVATIVPGDTGNEVIWTSSDESVATVSADGTVANRHTGTGRKEVTITVTCGDKSTQATIWCKGGSISASGTPGTVTGASAGLNVRSGPGTSHEAIATLLNGNSVTILEDAGGGWYKISFVGHGGRTETGYVSQSFITTG